MIAKFNTTDKYGNKIVAHETEIVKDSDGKWIMKGGAQATQPVQQVQAQAKPTAVEIPQELQENKLFQSLIQSFRWESLRTHTYGDAGGWGDISNHEWEIAHKGGKFFIAARGCGGAHLNTGKYQPFDTLEQAKMACVMYEWSRQLKFMKEENI